MRSVPLDILRAVAVLLIMGAHIPEALFLEKTPLTPFLSFWMQCGWTGVDLFFVISGFLVSGLLFKEYQKYQVVDLKKFFIRRGLKIYPAFYVFLLLSTVLLLLQGQHLPRLKQFAGEIFYIQNYYLHIWEHSWSLAVEEHFYLFVGFLVLYLSRSERSNPFRLFIPLSISCAVLILFFRVLNAYYVPYAHQTHLFPTHLRLDSLLFGVLLSYFHHFKNDMIKGWVKKRKEWIFVASLLLIAPAQRWSLFDPFMHSFGFTFLYLGYGGFLMLAVYCIDEQKVAANKIARFAAGIGVYSYSIYLWHIIFARMFKYIVMPGHEHFFLLSCLNLFIYVTGSVLTGIVMGMLIEMPLLRFRDKIFPSRSGSGLAL